MKKHTVEDLIKLIEEDYEIIGEPAGKFITHVKPITEADEHSLVWIRYINKHQILENNKAPIVICDASFKKIPKIHKERILIIVRNPKLVFIKLVEALFTNKQDFGIHATAVIHPEAKIASNTYVGPSTYVGKSEIGEGTIIYGNTHIYDNVRIGKNVVIQAGCIIGAEGYNFVRDENETLHKFPHLGRVIIEDDVEIQALTVIDRGVLSDTIVGKGTKIDSCCYIAHNCKIGKNNAIVGHTMLSGSVSIGDNCWIGPATTIRDGGIKIGNNSFVGMGSLVVKNLEAGSSVMGVPAKPIEFVKKMQNKLKDLVYED